MTTCTRRAAAILMLGALGAGCGGGGRDAPLTVLGAASLTDALEAIGAQYEAATGERLRFSFAASSTLARQIEAGAPADVFASADIGWMDELQSKGLIADGTRVEPIGNALALIAPGDSPFGELDVGPGLDLAGLLGPDGRLAVGDPDHVPAGQYGKVALEALGLWAAAEPRLARAEDVRGALALVARGEAPLGIVYSTDAAIAPGVKIVGVFPEASHPPIVYAFAILKDARAPAAERFLAYATSEPGLAVFERFGFVRR